jgi:ketosteroid isomerase-like protein
MKTKIFFGGLLLIIMALSFACHQKKEEAIVDKDKIKAEIQAIENQFALVYNSRNADSLTYYSDSAISYFDGQKPIVGKAAIHQFIQDELNNFPKGAKIANTTLEIFVTQDGNNVAEVGAYNRTDSTGKIIQSGHYFSFFAKRNGKFVCTRDMANSYPADSE